MLEQTLYIVPSFFFLFKIIPELQLGQGFRGQGGMTSRQLTRIVRQIFDHAYQLMLKEKGEDNARKLKEASLS